jgi:hypothetical protein
MRYVSPALVAAFIATLSVGSAAKAAVINFSAAAFCPASCTGITYTGATLGQSSAIDLDGTTWSVELLKLGEKSGLTVGDPLAGQTSATYGAVSGPGLDITLPTPIVRTWTGAFGSFTETLTTLNEVDRGTNAIAFLVSGTVNGGVFHDAPALLQFSLTQAGGPGNVISASLTNFATMVHEPTTWVMMGLGFIGLGYAAVRRSSNDRSALAV